MPCTASAMPSARRYRGWMIFTSRTRRTMRPSLSTSMKAVKALSGSGCRLPTNHWSTGRTHMSMTPAMTISTSKMLPSRRKKRTPKREMRRYSSRTKKTSRANSTTDQNLKWRSVSRPMMMALQKITKPTRDWNHVDSTKARGPVGASSSRSRFQSSALSTSASLGSSLVANEGVACEPRDFSESRSAQTGLAGSGAMARAPGPGCRQQRGARGRSLSHEA
mmetsp:Transcript_70181/g.227173  ORF Transcript_70181/g.227173 Transcript_70181/m.227173 type:complete len:221 (+) Transcript_70181:1185-1847(+)